MLFPSMALTSLNVGLYAASLITMMVDSMGENEGWSKQEKASNALLCMLGLGPGEIFGAIAFGRITDKCSHRTTVIVNVVVLTLAYALLILYCAIYQFSFPLAIAMTLVFGLQDSGINCLINSLLGFQFESKTTPFAVFKFLQSLLIVLTIYLCSLTDSQQGYLIFYCISCAFSIFSWFFLYKFFKVLPKEELDAMRSRKDSDTSER